MKVLVHEEGSDVAKSLFDAAGELVTASLGYVEARSALGRLVRAGRLKRSGHERARRELQRVWEMANVVHLDDRLVLSAGELADLQQLRAGDAIHLASALAVAQPDVVFATWDDKLGQAARDSGLAVAP